MYTNMLHSLYTSNQERNVIFQHPGESQAFGFAEFQNTLFDQGFGLVPFLPRGEFGLRILGIRDILE